MNTQKETLIIYIPGHGGGLHSNTYLQLKEHFENVACIVYNNQYPLEAEKTFEHFYQSINGQYQHLLIVGNSLGGYWANRYAQKWNADYILINPSLYPKNNLKKYGIHQEQLDQFTDSPLKVDFHPTIILGKKDEVVDYHKAIDFFGNQADITILENEGHQLSNKEIVIEKVTEKLKAINE